MLSEYHQPQTQQNECPEFFESDLWSSTQYEDSLTEEFPGNFSTQQASYLAKQKVFWIYTQTSFIKFDTTTKFKEYLHVFVEKMASVNVDKNMQAVLALFHFAPASFLSLLESNCRRLLEEGRCDQQLSASTIYTAVMMIEPDRFSEGSQMTRQGIRRLLKN